MHPRGIVPNEERLPVPFGLVHEVARRLYQRFIEAGYYTEHDKVIVGAIHAAHKNEAILGYAHDFNKQWRVQIDFQSGMENSSTIGFTWNITPDFQVNPAIYFPNYHPERILGYIVFTYTFHLWAKDKEKHDQTVPGG